MTGKELSDVGRDHPGLLEGQDNPSQIISSVQAYIERTGSIDPETASDLHYELKAAELQYHDH